MERKLDTETTESRRQVLIVDDNEHIRRVVRETLELCAEILVIGEAGEGRESIKLIYKLRPDVILMDVSMPVLDGIEATERITRELPHIRVIALSGHSDIEMKRRMLRAGAAGYFVKGEPMEPLLQLIKTTR